MTLAASWRAARLREAGRRGYFFLTPGLYALYRTFLVRGARSVKGCIMDARAGYGAWRPVLREFGRVTAVDFSAGERPDVFALWAALDRAVDRDGLFALNWMLLAHKK